MEHRSINKAFLELARTHRDTLGVYYGPSYNSEKHLLGFWSFVRDTDRPKGNGRLALQAVCGLADSFGLPIWLWTNVPKLYEYYESFGFSASAVGNYNYREYRREPRKLEVAR